MEAPPGVACMDTRHPRRLLTSGQAQIPHPLIMTKPQLTLLAGPGLLAAPALSLCPYSPKCLVGGVISEVGFSLVSSSARSVLVLLLLPHLGFGASRRRSALCRCPCP